MTVDRAEGDGFARLEALIEEGRAAVLGDRTDNEQACSEFSRRFSPRIIRHPNRSLYLTRFYLVGAPLTPKPFDNRGNPKKGIKWPRLPFGLYLHHFHASDLPRFHNHPWSHAASLMLHGGYVEYREGEEPRTVVPGDHTRLTRSTFHRVELIGEDAWTLFAVGPFVGMWGYRPDPNARGQGLRW